MEFMCCVWASFNGIPECHHLEPCATMISWFGLWYCSQYHTYDITGMILTMISWSKVWYHSAYHAYDIIVWYWLWYWLWYHKEIYDIVGWKRAQNIIWFLYLISYYTYPTSYYIWYDMLVDIILQYHIRYHILILYDNDYEILPDIICHDAWNI